MRVRVKSIDNAALLARSPQARRAALFEVSGNVRSDNEPRVPKLHGGLRGSARSFVSSDDRGVVEWGGDADTAPYARAQHAGTNGIVRFKDYSEPGTGPDWTEETRREREGAWREMFAREYGRGLRG